MMTKDDKEKDPKIDQAFAVLAQESKENDAVPDAEMLHRWREGTLTEAESETLLEDAARVPEFAQLLLDARAFPNLEPSAEEQAVLESFSTPKGWRELKEELESAPEGTRRPKSAFTETLTRYTALAAALVLGIGLGFLIPRGQPEKSLINPATISFTETQLRQTRSKNETEPQQRLPQSQGLALKFNMAVFLEEDRGPISGKLSHLASDFTRRFSVIPDDQGIFEIIWWGHFETGIYRIALERDNEEIWFGLFQLVAPSQPDGP